MWYIGSFVYIVAKGVHFCQPAWLTSSSPPGPRHRAVIVPRLIQNKSEQEDRLTEVKETESF